MPPEREHDIHIIDWVCQRRNIFQDRDIKIINYCRQYLHATTVSELFDANGEFMLEYMYQCHRPLWFNTKQFVTLQRRPSNYQIRKKWQPLCRMWCDAITRRRAPHVDFGDWTHKATRVRPYRQTYIESNDDGSSTIYHFHDQKYWSTKQHPSRLGHYSLLDSTEWKPRNNATPIAIIKCVNCVISVDIDQLPSWVTSNTKSTHAHSTQPNHLTASSDLPRLNQHTTNMDTGLVKRLHTS
jgi:hypothetical protein